MNLRTTMIDGKIVDVISEEEFVQNWRSYNEDPAIYNSLAVEYISPDNVSYVLPFRGKTDNLPGIYPDGSLYFINTTNAEQYQTDNLEIVDFRNTNSIKEFLQNNNQIKDMETIVLSDAKDIFIPTIGPRDTPEMRVIKEAVISKHIDINKYAPRFGPNFLNDKRIFRGGTISINKLREICEKLDIQATLELEDKNPNVVNPMSKKITVVLTKDEGES